MSVIQGHCDGSGQELETKLLSFLKSSKKKRFYGIQLSGFISNLNKDRCEKRSVFTLINSVVKQKKKSLRLISIWLTSIVVVVP